MAKGGSTETKTEIPGWLEDSIRGNIDRSNRISEIGHVAYRGPDVAALSPSQTAAMGNDNSMAGAFGMQTAPSGLPEPTTFAGGVRGYSAAPLFDAAVDDVRTNAPGQYDAITGLFVDPITGERPNGWAPQQGTTAQSAAETPQQLRYAEHALTSLLGGVF